MAFLTCTDPMHSKTFCNNFKGCINYKNLRIPKINNKHNKKNKKNTITYCLSMLF